MSVKQFLEHLFPTDTLNAMRTAPKETVQAHPWVFADRFMLKFFAHDERFLEETILTEEGILYLFRTNGEKGAYLSVLRPEGEPFPLSAAQGLQFCRTWEEQGYRTRIVAIALSHNGREYDDYRSKAVSYLPVECKGHRLYTIDNDPFWSHAEATLCSGKNLAYLLSPEVELTKGTRTLQGIDAVTEELQKHPLSFYYWKEDEFSYTLSLGDETGQYQLTVGTQNKIVKLEHHPLKERIPADTPPKPYPRPALTAVTPLPIERFHGYSLRLTFADECEKDYHLHTFTTLEPPASAEVDGYRFDAATLATAALHQGGVRFANGCFLSGDQLYYDGFTRQSLDRNGQSVEHGGIRLEFAGRVPHQMRRTNLYSTFPPRPDEFFGPDDAPLPLPPNFDYYAEAERFEGNGKVGYRKADGTLLVPPIFDKGDSLRHGQFALAKRDGTQYLVTPRGRVLPFEHEIDLDYCETEPFPFSVGDAPVSPRYPALDRLDEMTVSGLWGYIDAEGQVVAEPQYVFAIPFGQCTSDRAMVARIIEGDTRWGLLDPFGNEAVPCIYTELTDLAEGYFGYQLQENGRYGIMDREGNRLTPPQFGYLDNYDPAHRLLVAGDDEDHVGCFSLQSNSFLIPPIYSYIWLEEEITCGTESKEFDYDYSGRLLSPPQGYWLHHKKGKYLCWINGQLTLTDSNGTPLCPEHFDQIDHCKLYDLGYRVFGTKDGYGLTRLNGTPVLPARYSRLEPMEPFICAEQQAFYNDTYRTELLWEDGTPVFDFPLRSAWIHRDFLCCETALGTEYYRIKT